MTAKAKIIAGELERGRSYYATDTCPALDF